MTHDRIGLRALNRATLQRQMLLARSTRTPAQAIERLVGLQAQAPNPPYVGLWSRLDNFRIEQLSALMRQRRIVRVALMRSTLHLVTARDCLALRPLLQPMLWRSVNGAYRRAIEGLDAAALVAAGRALLAEQPHDNAELGRALAARWPGRDGAALAGALRNLAPLVHLPPAGTWNSHASAKLAPADVWLGAPPAGPLTQDELLLRYLGAFGPATLADAAAWSGLGGWKAVAERLRRKLRVFVGDEGQELFDLPRAPRPHPDTPAPPRLVAEWDNLLLSHAERSRVLSEAHRPRVFTVNGIVRGTALVDGFVAGTWKIHRRPGHATLAVERFSRWSAAERQGIEAEGLNLLAFAAPGDAADVRIAEAAA